MEQVHSLHTISHTHTDSSLCVRVADVMCEAPGVTLNKPYKPLQVVKP